MVTKVELSINPFEKQWFCKYLWWYLFKKNFRNKQGQYLWNEFLFAWKM